ncbi:phage tail terminator family protein [Peptoniphilus asaccharolyticus]
MVKGTDIAKAVKKLINKNFEDKVINSESLEDFKKPYFFVYFEDFSRQSYSNSNDVVDYGVVVQYQKADKIKLMEIGDKLSELFNYSLKLDDLFVLITENSWEIEKNSLFFYFNVQYYVDKIKHDVDFELMKHIFVEYERRQNG